MWKKVIIAGSVLVAGICVWKMGSSESETNLTTQSIFAMDTYMDITVYGQESEQAVELAVAEIHRLDALFSTGNEKSEVATLNQEKEGVLSEDYAYLLERSMELHELTQGLFDITIYPIMRAWGFTDKAYRVPEDEELTTLLQHVDTSKLNYDKDAKTLRLPQEVEVDFGGIAKGYTSIRVAQLLKEQGIKSAILNLGGNVQTVGLKPDGSRWKIAIKSPYEDLAYLGVLSIGETAVITSGGYERCFEENGETYHHIIDTGNGYPAQSGVVSVTIVCEDGTLADGLSTSLFVMGKEKAITYWKAHNEVFEFVLCDEDRRLYVTQGLADNFTSDLPIEIIYVD